MLELYTASSLSVIRLNQVLFSLFLRVAAVFTEADYTQVEHLRIPGMFRTFFQRSASADSSAVLSAVSQTTLKT
jgi:hypothetical protein